MAARRRTAQFHGTSPATSGGGKPGQRREFFPHPTDTRASQEGDRTELYDLLWSYYSNRAFDELKDWISYRRKYGLYKHVAGLFNPVTRLVDFYADCVYPGTVTIDGDLEHTNGTLSAVPLAHDTPQDIRKALGTIWRWSNWQVKAAQMVTFAGATGNCLVEVVDNLPKGKVSFNVRFPTLVKDFALDEDGDLVFYKLSYPIFDRASGKRQLYEKEVTAFSITTWIDGDVRSAVENPYGFVPAAWVKHIDIGSDFGVPAIKGAIAKIDGLNSLTTHTKDHVHKQIKSPRVLWMDGNIVSAFKGDAVSTDEEFDVRGDITMLKGKAGGKTESLVGNLDPATTVPVVCEMVRELEKDFPELTFYDKLREQNIVTAPGAKMLIGDVENKVKRVSVNYDTASTKLFAMALAIGGYRANLNVEEGGWGFGLKKTLRQDQKLLKPFNLEAYSAGQLNVTILPRPLIQETSREEAEQLQIRGQGIANLEDTLPVAERLSWLGYKPEEIPKIVAALKKEQKEKSDLAIKQAKATKPQQAGATASTRGKASGSKAKPAAKKKASR